MATTLKSRLRRIQAHIGAVADGVFGPETLGKLEEELGVGGMGEAVAAPAMGGRFDTRTEKNLKTLAPNVLPVFRKLVGEAKAIAWDRASLVAKVISGTRTYKEQDALYAKGRSKPGNRVTNAPAGFSNHNFGIAIDFGLFRGARTYVDAADPALAAEVYREIAEVARGLDISWGGDWRSFKDTPHFQFNNGLTTAQMRARVRQGKAVV